MTISLQIFVATLPLMLRVDAFFTIPSKSRSLKQKPMCSKSWKSNDSGNTWKISIDDKNSINWETTLKKQKDGSYWSDFESSEPTNEEIEVDNQDDIAETMLDAMATLLTEDSDYNIRDAQRANTARQMEEWGFDSKTIASALDVAVEEGESELEGMRDYREGSYIDNEDLANVESHTKVPIDEVTKEPIRSQMVYVDEHACIGCTNCAMIAQSTFFMEEENGRARVFEQWGDDETTIGIAMETCPVDCIHYVQYEELVQLEVKRRNQFINVVGGLVSRAERGAGSTLNALTPRSFGAKRFTDAPKVSSGYDRNNEEFLAKERVRLVKERRKELELKRRRENKIVDL